MATITKSSGKRRSKLNGSRISSRKFRVGDRVTIPYGGDFPAIAVVVEDWGIIGGEQWLALRKINDLPAVEQGVFSLPASNLSRAK